MLVELRNIDAGVLERAEVSKRGWQAIQTILDVDKDIFHEEAKLHVTNHLLDNPYSNFVDFTRLPKDIPKKAKDLLYRPQKMQKLCESYHRLVKQLENDFMAKKLELETWEKHKASKLQWHGRIPRKEKDELAMIDEILDVAEKTLYDENDEKLMKFLTTADIPGLKL